MFILISMHYIAFYKLLYKVSTYNTQQFSQTSPAPIAEDRHGAERY